MRPESVAAIRRSLRAEVVTRASVSGRRAARDRGSVRACALSLPQRRGSVRACALSLPANASRWLYGASRHVPGGEGGDGDVGGDCEARAGATGVTAKPVNFAAMRARFCSAF